MPISIAMLLTRSMVITIRLTNKKVMEKLSSFDDRVARLEKLLCGKDTNKVVDVKIIQEVEKYNAKIKDAERASKNLKKIYSQLDDLQKYVSLCHSDVLSKPPKAMVDYIETSEKQLKEQAQQLENVDRLKWVLESEHLKSRVTSDLNIKLLQVSQKQGLQKEEVSSCLDESKQLVDNYNKAISAVTKQFERWNAMITTMEERCSQGIVDE
ncbi:DCTN3 [Bugula neritina]|uniref:DCTN3 n=1 Tax=Bugula neritina TaxID=10212 RepID=A0A7J7JIV7_BUGNE|nr:DCTN3 [Bugula neritina]